TMSTPSPKLALHVKRRLLWVATAVTFVLVCVVLAVYAFLPAVLDELRQHHEHGAAQQAQKVVTTRDGHENVTQARPEPVPQWDCAAGQRVLRRVETGGTNGFGRQRHLRNRRIYTVPFGLAVTRCRPSGVNTTLFMAANNVC